MLKETDEQYHQMELEDLFDTDIKPNLFAVSKVFAEARKQMNLAEYKTFTYALSNIKWKDDCPDVLYADKKTVAGLVGVNSDASDLSQNLKRSIGDMAKHSYLEFSDKDSGTWVNGAFITSIGFFKNRIRIRMNPDFLGLFGGLDKNYITLWSEDIYKMRSERSVKFYELLRMNSDTRLPMNEGMIGIRKFKELFDIPKDGPGSYMREKSGFDRSQFEKRVIDPVCADLAHTDMIQLILQPDGKYYEKVKRGGRVIAYKFFWTISQHPAVATAEEKKQLQEQVDQDPQILKVAKDIAAGKKRKKKNNKGDKEESKYSELERLLLRK